MVEDIVFRSTAFSLVLVVEFLRNNLRGLLVAVGRCDTQVRLSLIYVPGQPPRPPVPGIL